MNPFEFRTSIPQSIPLEENGTPVSTIMITKVHSCKQDDTIADVVAEFVHNDIGGMPVVDDDNHVVGFISDGDIMSAIAQHRAHSIFTGSDASMLYFDNENLETRIDDLSSRTASEFMTRKVICALPEQSIARVAALLSHKKVKMLPVVDKQGVLKGIVQRSAVTRYLFKNMFKQHA